MKFKKTYNHKLSSHKQSPHSTEFPQEPLLWFPGEVWKENS